MLNSFRIISLICLIGLITIFPSLRATAADLQNPLTQFAVFPFYGVEGKKAEEAWWQVRESLTKGQSLYVAERRLMINRGVFDPRKDLKPADSIILGKILEAEALIVFAVEDSQLKMAVYETESGQSLWRGELTLKSTLLVEDQIGWAATTLVQQFLYDIPYQTFQAKVADSDAFTQEMEGKLYSSILRQGDQDLEVGDRVQWIELISNGPDSLYQGGVVLSVQAEGLVTHLEDSTARVEVVKMRDAEVFRNKALIRLPDSLLRLKNKMSDSGDKKDFLSREYLAAEIRPVKELKQNNSATASSLSWIASLGVLILLAF